MDKNGTGLILCRFCFQAAYFFFFTMVILPFTILSVPVAGWAGVASFGVGRGELVLT